MTTPVSAAYGTPILLVEDDPADLRLEKEMLADVGVTTPIATAATLAAALRRIGEGVSCVVLDLGLPDATGLESLVAVLGAAPDVPVVVLTGLMDEAAGAQAVAAGAQDYLIKNEVDGRLLAHSIRYAIERRRSQAALRDVEQREHSVLALTPIVLLTFDQEAVVTLADGSGLGALGLTASDLVGASLFERYAGFPALMDAVRAALAGEDASAEIAAGPAVWEAKLCPLRDAGGRVSGGVLVSTDVTERVTVTRALEVLSSGNQVLVHATNEDELLANMCRTVVEVGGHALSWVGYAQHDEARSVRPMATAGDAAYLTGLRVSWGDDLDGQGPTGTAIRTGRIQVLDDLGRSPSGGPWRERATRHGFGSLIALPLEVGGAVIGAISIYSRRARAFDPAAVGRLAELAGDLAYGIGRAREAMRLDRSMEGTIAALATTVEVRDPYTAGHQRRVGELAGAIAERLGLDAGYVRGIRIAGAMHDIGKVYVPAEILTRPGRLAGVEFELIKRHPQIGADILTSVEFPWPVAEWIIQHHERLDGSGYPNGAARDDVVEGSRILAVSDTVEAMTHMRPYRPALGLDAALAQITNDSGRLYDVAVVEACRSVFLDGSFTWGD